MLQRLTKLAAAARLDVSLSTIDRMILRGDLSIEKEPHGSRHKVWVLLDDNALDKSPVGGTEGSSDLSGEISDTVELRILRERVRSLEELAAYHREQLKESELRFQQLLQQLDTSQRTLESFTRALPAPGADNTGRRSWWPWKRPTA